MVEMQSNDHFKEPGPINRSEASDKPANRAARLSPFRRRAIGVALIAGAALLTHAGYHYWTVGRYLESTDDAYVQADYTTVAPKVSGYISSVLVADNQIVKKGDVLAHIDDRDFRTALAAAQANVRGARATVDNLEARIALQQSLIAQSEAKVASSRASLKFAQVDSARYQRLLKTGYGAAQRAQKAKSILQESSAAFQQATAGMIAAHKMVDVLNTNLAKATAELDQAKARAEQAQLNLTYTSIIAPVDGTVGAKALRVGAFVQAGTQLMAIVPLHAVYIIANFKETQITNIRSGEHVSISIDGYPDVTLKGHVDSLSPASGLEFSLLPPDNATGNFTKIVQRVPVKIVVDAGDGADTLYGLLRPGMSVEPTVDTKVNAPTREASLYD